MATFTKFQQFVENLGKGVHDFTSDSTCTLTVALTAAANAPDAATDTVLTDLTQVSYTNLSSRVFSNVSYEQTGGTATLDADDLVLTASGAVATFRYIVLYDDDPTSPADPLIGYLDYGSDLTLSSGQTLTIDLTTGFLTVA